MRRLVASSVSKAVRLGERERAVRARLWKRVRKVKIDWHVCEAC